MSVSVSLCNLALSSSRKRLYSCAGLVGGALLDVYCGRRKVSHHDTSGSDWTRLNIRLCPPSGILAVSLGDELKRDWSCNGAWYETACVNLGRRGIDWLRSRNLVCGALGPKSNKAEILAHGCGIYGFSVIMLISIFRPLKLRVFHHTYTPVYFCLCCSGWRERIPRHLRARCTSTHFDSSMQALSKYLAWTAMMIWYLGNSLNRWTFPTPWQCFGDAPSSPPLSALWHLPTGESF